MFYFKPFGYVTPTKKLQVVLKYNLDLGDCFKVNLTNESDGSIVKHYSSSIQQESEVIESEQVVEDNNINQDDIINNNYNDILF